MNAVLIQLAVLLGGLVAGVSLVMNLSSQMELLTAVFRAVLVFFATVIVLFFFLRYFSMIMVQFVSEQVLKRRNQNNKSGNDSSDSSDSDTEKKTT